MKNKILMIIMCIFSIGMICFIYDFSALAEEETLDDWTYQYYDDLALKQNWTQYIIVNDIKLYYYDGIRVDVYEYAKKDQYYGELDGLWFYNGEFVGDAEGYYKTQYESEGYEFVTYEKAQEIYNEYTRLKKTEIKVAYIGEQEIVTINTNGCVYYSLADYIVACAGSMSGTSTTDGVTCYKFKAVLDETVEEIELGKQQAKAVADSLSGKSVYEQIKGAYEWLCNNVSYDHSYFGRGIHSAMIERTCVCEGYAEAFQAIMDSLNIPCYIVTGYVNGPHAWNAVQYENKWYYVDATWGDQVTYIDYTYLLAGKNIRSIEEIEKYVNISANSYMYISFEIDTTEAITTTEKPSEVVSSEFTELNESETVTIETTLQENVTEDTSNDIEQITKEFETDTESINIIETEVAHKPVKESSSNNNNNSNNSNNSNNKYIYYIGGISIVAVIILIIVIVYKKRTGTP